MSIEMMDSEIPWKIRIFFFLTQAFLLCSCISWELFKTISSSVLILYGPNLTSIQENWKNHGFDYTAICMQVKKQDRTWHGTMDWFKIGKGVCQGCVLSACFLTYMQSTSCEMPGWMKQKLEARFLGEISITSDMQMTPPLWQKGKRN